MGQITLNREDSERILANKYADPGARLMAAAAIVFFESGDSALDADRRSLAIAQKLLHLSQCRVYEALDEVQS